MYLLTIKIILKIEVAVTSKVATSRQHSLAQGGMKVQVGQMERMPASDICYCPAGDRRSRDQGGNLIHG